MKSKTGVNDFNGEGDEMKLDFRFPPDDYGKLNLLIEAPVLDKGGMEEVIYNIATHLTPATFRVVVVGVHRGGYLEDRLRKAGIPVEILGQEKEREYIEILHRYRIDLVNTHYSHFGPPIAFQNGIPIVSFIHSIYNWVSNRLLDDFRKVDPFISEYIAVSKDVARYAQYRFNIAPERIQIIPDGIDPRRFSLSKAELPLTRRDLGLDEDDFIFLHVGAISRTKMHNLMIAALRSLPKNMAKIKILCLGQILQEDYYLIIQKKIQEEGLQNRMMLL